MLCVARHCTQGPERDCNDADACTLDACDAQSGDCSHEPLTPDLDEDGFRAPLPGSHPGEDGACGNDCDDTRDSSHPDGIEICDGADNDCNGVTDDGFEYAPTSAAPKLLTSGNKSGLGGIAHDGEHFAVSLSYNKDHDQNRVIGLDDSGQTLFENDLALVNSDTFAGPLWWTGQWFATAWEDRRNEDYEIYFNRLDADGNKLGPDLRVSNAPDFSLNPALVFTGNLHVLAWNDRRLDRGTNHIFGQLISAEGELLSDENIDLTPDAAYAESPSLALGARSIALVYSLQTDAFRVAFRAFDLELAAPGPELTLSAAGGNGASVIPLGEQYVVAWDEYLKVPGDAIWGAIVDPSGATVHEPVRLTETAAFARTHSILNLGDRLLLFWAQADTGRYAIYTRTLNLDLSPRTKAELVVESDSDALGPDAAFGNGSLGLAYTSYVDGSPQVFFTTLACVR